MSNKDCIQTDFFGKIYAYAAETIRVGNFDFPTLPPQQLHPDPHALPINYITSKMTARMLRANWFHCHVDDRHFEKYWNNLDQYKPTITQVGGVIGPDYSVYRNFSVERQMYNVYRNRVLTYAITQINPNVIPAATFGGKTRGIGVSSDFRKTQPSVSQQTGFSAIRRLCVSLSAASTSSFDN